MIRVLHVLGTTNLGGAESRIMDLYRHIDRDKVQFDFLVHTNKPGHFDEEIKSLGGNVYYLPRFKFYNLFQYKKAAKLFFKEHHDYSVVQGHMTSTASIYLPIAQKAGIGCVIAHTRNAGVDAGIKGVLTNFLRKSLPKKADFLFACSHLAGDETFRGAPYTYIPNTIDTNRFLFDESMRLEIRQKYSIPDDSIVIGNVARFNPQKNQRYLIEAFSKLPSNYYLIFCGDGELKADCEEQSKSYGEEISKRIVFAGNQKEVQKYYSAMDIFAFPSIYEGLPGVVVEAQAAGLICLISDKITSEVLITDVSEALDIDGSADVWSKKIEEKTSACDINNRQEYASQVRQAGFDVNDQANIMLKFYLNPCEENLPRFD